MRILDRLMAPEDGDGAAAGGGDTAAPGSVGAAPAAAAPAAATQLPPGSAAAAPAAAAGDEGKGYWPDDWQTKVAKGDEKRAAHIKRYASPEAMADALIAAQNRIRAGDLKAALPENAKPEELSAWRKDNGIPDAPDKYDLKFDDGLAIGAEDKPIIDAFLKTAHAANMKPEQVKTAVKWYYDEQTRQAEERSQKDVTERAAALDVLNAEWGRDFRRNINMVQGLLSMFPEETRLRLEGARMPDGTGVFNDPEVMRSFASLALQVNPAGIIAPAGGGDIGANALAEYQTIQKFMSTNRKTYDKDTAMQAKFSNLIDYLLKQGQIDENGNVKSQKKAA